MQLPPCTTTDGICNAILDRAVDIEDIARQEQQWCDIADHDETALRSLAVLETIQEIRSSLSTTPRWRDLIEWCRKKRIHAHPDIRGMYDDALTEYLTSAAYEYCLQMNEGEEMPILNNDERIDPFKHLFSELYRRHGPNDKKNDILAA